MLFEIDEAVQAAFPQHGSALLQATADQPLRPRDGAIERLAAAFERDPSATTGATAYWRGVFAAMGAKPKYGPSIEKLHQMACGDGNRLRIPLPLVEMYCWFSLVEGVPMAGYRTEGIVGTLRLAMPGAGIPFRPLGQAGRSQEKTKPREVAYIDDEKAICRYWNYRDCDQAKLVDGITSAMFVFDLVDADGLAGTNAAPDLAARFIEMLEGPIETELTVVSPTASPPPS